MLSASISLCDTYTGDFGPFVTFHGGAPGVSETLESRYTSDLYCHTPPQASPPLQLQSKMMFSDNQCSVTAASLPAPSAPISFS